MNSNMEKPYVVGIDIGGTNTVFGIVDARGTIIASSSIKTAGYPTAAEYADEVCKNLLPLIIANGGVDKIRGIGVGAPNGNYYTGTIEFAPNLPWKGIQRPEVPQHARRRRKRRRCPLEHRRQGRPYHTGWQDHPQDPF